LGGQSRKSQTQKEREKGPQHIWKDITKYDFLLQGETEVVFQKEERIPRPSTWGEK